MTRLLLVFLIACGAAPKKTTTGATGASGASGDEEGTAPTTAGGKDFTIGAQAASVVQGGSKQINITLTRTGGAFPVTLSMGEADAGVRATFAQAVSNSNTVAATVEVVSSVAVGTYKIMINASGADKMHSASIAVSVTAKMLGGSVVDERGRPVVGADVFAGSAAKITTDANGAFALAGVSGTYDVTVKKDSDVWIFRGLTRTDPALQLYGYAPDDQYTANVSGIIANIAPAPSGDATTALVLGTTACCGSAWLDASADNYDNWLWWSVSPMTNATLHALEWAVSGDITDQGIRDNTPISFLRYTSKPNVGMNNEALAGGQNMDFGATSLQNGTLAGTVTTPSDYILLSRDMYVRLPGDHASLRVAHQTSSLAKTFSYPAPMITGATVGVMQHAQHSKGTSWAFASDLSPTQGAVTLTLPTAPVNTIPGGTITASSSFSFTPMTGGGVHVMEFLPTGAGPKVYIIGSQTTAALPNLTATGTVIPPKAPYTYAVHGFSTATTDAASGPDGFCTGHAGFQNNQAPKGSGTFASSTPKSFTTP